MTSKPDFHPLIAQQQVGGLHSPLASVNLRLFLRARPLLLVPNGGEWQKGLKED
jgi:hypothetical protein